MPIVGYNNFADKVNMQMRLDSFEVNGSDSIINEESASKTQSIRQKLNLNKTIVSYLLIFGWLVHAVILLGIGIYIGEPSNKKAYKWTSLIIALIGLTTIGVHTWIGIASWGGSGLI